MGGIDRVRSPALWGPAASASPWGVPGKLGLIALGSEQLVSPSSHPARIPPGVSAGMRLVSFPAWSESSSSDP